MSTEQSVSVDENVAQLFKDDEIMKFMTNQQAINKKDYGDVEW